MGSHALNFGYITGNTAFPPRRVSTDRFGFLLFACRRKLPARFLIFQGCPFFISFIFEFVRFIVFHSVRFLGLLLPRRRPLMYKVPSTFTVEIADLTFKRRALFQYRSSLPMTVRSSPRHVFGFPSLVDTWPVLRDRAILPFHTPG